MEVLPAVVRQCDIPADYSIADSLIAGKSIGETALAAVGNAYEVTLLFLSVSFGCNIGCSVITAQKFGARQYGEMKTAVYTSLIGSGVAWATLICQGVSCVFAMVVVFGKLRRIRTEGAVQMFSGKHLRQIAIVAIPSMLQQSFISEGNIVIQGIINPYGSSGIWLAWPIGWGLGTVLSGTFVLTVLYKRATVDE